MAARRTTCPTCQKRLVLRSHQQSGRRVKCPQCGQYFVVSGVDGRDEDRPQVPAETSRALPPPIEWEATPSPDRAAVQEPSPPFPGIVKTPALSPGEVQIEIEPKVTIDRPIRRGRRSRGPGRFASIAGGTVLLLVIATGFAWFRRPPAVPITPRTEPAGKQTGARETVATPAHIQWRAGELRPAEGEPIRLFMVPSGARVLVHFRPSQLWSDDARMSELRGSLTQDVVGALDAVVRNLVNRDPAAVEEILFVWTLGAPGSAPLRTAVVRLVKEEQLSDLIEEFGGTPHDEYAQHKVYLREDRAVLIRDRRTLAFAPRELAAELAEWIETPNDNTSDGMLAVLEHTDRERLLTIVFEPAEVLRHVDGLFPESARLIAREVTSWFDSHAETVAWSIGTGAEFSSEIILRGRSTSSSSSVAKQVTGQLDALPARLVEIVRELNPQRAGFRRMTGRFPAMMEVVRRATLTAVGDRLVRLSTVLPSKAAPNLSLAMILIWDQSTRSRSADSGRPAPLAAGESAAPQTLAEKLQRPIDAEFIRTPLQEAIDYIGNEIGVEIEIDGDAMKDAGYTRNMPQTFNLGRVPAAAAIRAIIAQYQEPGKEMVLVLDEPGKRATILTMKFAKRAGQVPYELGP